MKLCSPPLVCAICARCPRAVAPASAAADAICRRRARPLTVRPMHRAYPSAPTLLRSACCSASMRRACPSALALLRSTPGTLRPCSALSPCDAAPLRARRCGALSATLLRSAPGDAAPCPRASNRCERRAWAHPVEYPSNMLVFCVRSGTDASHSRDAQRGLHALYSRTNAPVYHDGLALLRPGALGRMSPRARTCVRALCRSPSCAPTSNCSRFHRFQLKVGPRDVQGSMTRGHVPNH